VAFENPQRLERLGIQSWSPEVAHPVNAMSHLQRLALATLLYVEDHKGSLPSEIAELKPYLRDESQFTWTIVNVEYLGKGVRLSEVVSRAAKPLAYWKTPTVTNGTVVAFLDGHARFVQKDGLPELGIAVTFPARTQAGGPEGALRTYEVNRRVADFPSTEDFSTPEAAYATINRIDRNDPSAWQKASVAALAESFAREGNTRKTRADPEWAKVLANARILQVMIWNNARAAVLAELPQALASKKIVAPIDVRSLELENGRWLNAGNDRVRTVEEAKARFLARYGGAQQKTK
jgi:hypothetical protein